MLANVRGMAHPVDQPDIERARNKSRERAHGEEEPDVVGIDLALRAQQREINHQQIERGDGDHARDHNRGKPTQLEQLPDRHNGAGFHVSALVAAAA